MTNNRDSLGDRIKENYENRSKTFLLRRTPVIIRLDGKAFHTFTRGFAKPFDKILTESMQETTLELCKNVQGCVVGYTQSDEITLVLADYQTLDTCAWFDYNVQKVCSIASSMCTLYFNRIFNEKVIEFSCKLPNEDSEKLLAAYNKSIKIGAMFDARCFNVPLSEVTNVLLWRQNDASRNSIFSLARAHFSHKQLQGKSGSQLQDMLMEKLNINWNDLPTIEKRGSSVIKNDDGKWLIDTEMPILKGEDRQYIESRINFEA